MQSRNEKHVSRALRLALTLGLAGLLLLSDAGHGQTPPAPASTLTLLDQGNSWNARRRAQYHFTPQGSRLMPRSWFLALERVDPGAPAGSLFAAPDNLARFGFIHAADDAGTGLNPDGLPIGFAIDPYDEPGRGRWMGLTCAACHTNEITHSGTRLRIEGAPAAIDFDRFGAELAAAVQAPLLEAAALVPNPARLNRMAERVASLDGQTATRFLAAYPAYAAASDTLWRLQRPALEAGPGRLDALGQIMNALTALQLGEPANARPPAAPTSYPFLWTTPRQDYVQWAPIAGNPLDRNVGEVLGVFGHAELTARNWPRNLSGTSPSRFASTVRFRDLFELEAWIAELAAPAWPDALFGRLDEPLWRQGQALVADEHRSGCLSCHSVPPHYRMTEPGESVSGRRYIRTTAVPLAVVQTDPAYTRALVTRTMHVGAAADVLDGGPVIAAADALAEFVGLVSQRGLDALNLSPEERLAYGDHRFLPVPAGAPPGTLPQPWGRGDPRRAGTLKAGPLEGLWATGPFLHNGSVATLDELLRPPAERRPVFWTGGRELDLKHIGFVSEQAPGLFRFDTSLPGNGNGGHAFPAVPFTPEERRAVLEYLKDPAAQFPRSHAP